MKGVFPIGLFQKSKKRVRADPVKIWMTGSDNNEIILPQGYVPLEKNEEVRTCIHKIADMVSSMTIMLMENGDNGDVRIRDELAKKIDVTPNNHMTRKNFIYKIVTDMLVRGNAVVYPETSNKLIENLVIWDMNKVHFEKTGNSYAIRYGVSTFEPDEVLHFPCIPDDDNPFIGRGMISLIEGVITNLNQANATKSAFLKSKWKPSLILAVNSDISELQDLEYRKNILGSYTKTTEVGEPWLIPAGEITATTVKPLTLHDLAIQDSITLDKKVIASSIGIPPFMVGVGDFNKDAYNNFISTTIMPIAMIIQQELTKKLLTSGKRYFKFNPKSLMQYDLSEKISFVKEMVGGGMLNRNEGRNEFDYAPVDDKGMNEYNVLENYIPVARLGDQKKLIQKEGEEDG